MPSGEILERLGSGRAEEAWKAFLEEYGSLILQVARQYEHDIGRINDCFLYICERLSDDGFRRLLNFDINRGASFRGWLKSVVSNLCIDWHRREFGRFRLFSAITRLPAFDQLVFKYKFEMGLSLDACYRALKVSNPGLTTIGLAETVGCIHSASTTRQGWPSAVTSRHSSILPPGSFSRPIRVWTIRTVNVRRNSPEQTGRRQCLRPATGSETSGFQAGSRRQHNLLPENICW